MTDEIKSTTVSDMENHLAHHGVKGQKWGVRKSRMPISPASQRRAAVGDAASSVLKGTGLNILSASHIGLIPVSQLAPLTTVYHSSRSEINSGARVLNTKYTQPGHDMRTNKKLQTQYDQDYQKMVSAALNRSKSPWIAPVRKLAEKRVGKTSDNAYKLNFYMVPGKKRDKAFLTIMAPNGNSEDVKVGSFKHSDEGKIPGVLLSVNLSLDSDGFITDFKIPDLDDLANNMAHSDVEAFLAHHGIKGQKWGVRRAHPSGGGGSGSRLLGRLKARKQSKAEAEAIKKAPPGTIGAAKNSEGKFITVQKKADGTWEETHLSVDAERFMRTHMKAPHEMSDVELRAFLNRAKMMKEFDDLALFKENQKGPNQELKDKAERLDLQVKINSNKAKLRGPSKTQKVASFVAGMSPAFSVFKKMDDLTGNTMSGHLKKSLQEALNGTSSSSTSRPTASKSRPRSTFKVNPNKVRITPDPVFNISNVGQPDPAPGNPFIPALPPGN